MTDVGFLADISACLVEHRHQRTIGAQRGEMERSVSFLHGMHTTHTTAAHMKRTHDEYCRWHALHGHHHKPARRQQMCTTMSASAHTTEVPLARQGRCRRGVHPLNACGVPGKVRVWGASNKKKKPPLNAHGACRCRAGPPTPGAPYTAPSPLPAYRRVLLNGKTTL